MPGFSSLRLDFQVDVSFDDALKVFQREFLYALDGVSGDNCRPVDVPLEIVVLFGRGETFFSAAAVL